MIATVKPLDLAQFDGLDGAIAISAYNSAHSLLAECRRQREDIAIMEAMLRNRDAKISMLREALELTAATVELNTGNGARSQPDWPRIAAGHIDYDRIAQQARAALEVTK